MSAESSNTGDFSFGTGDFTVEGYFFPLNVSAASEVKTANIRLERTARTFTVHTQKSIDGVLYMSTQVFDEHKSMLSEQLIRADLVRG